MITVEEFLSNGNPNYKYDLYNFEEVTNCMIEFAKLHVTEALKVAHSQHQLPMEDLDFTLDAYPLNNIK